MIEKKYNWKIWFLIIFFSGVLVLAARVILMLATNQVVYGSGSSLPMGLIVLICGMIVLVCSTYVSTIVSALMQVFKYKNLAFRIDDTGIHDTIVIINVLAFVFAARIKFIPWSSVKYVDETNGDIYLRVKRDQITAGSFGKLLIWIMGYHFNNSLLKHKFSDSEKKLIRSYIKKQSPHLTDQ